MKFFKPGSLVLLLSLLLAFSLLVGCSVVFAPKDMPPGSAKSSSSGGNKSNTPASKPPPKLSTDEQKNMNEYEKYQKAENHKNLGAAYLRSNRHNQALAEYKQALQLVPNDYDLMYEIGLVYLTWNNPEDAIPYFEDTLALRPNYGPAINSLGNAYLAMKQYDMAISYYNQIDDTIIYVTPHLPLTNTGIAYFQKGDYAKAEEYYNRALKIEPDYINALVLLGQLQLQTGKNQEALKNLIKANRLQSAPVIKYYLAKAYVATGNKAEAEKLYKEILAEALPETEVYQESQAELNRLNN